MQFVKLPLDEFFERFVFLQIVQVLDEAVFLEFCVQDGIAFHLEFFLDNAREIEDIFFDPVELIVADPLLRRRLADNIFDGFDDLAVDVLFFVFEVLSKGTCLDFPDR